MADLKPQCIVINTTIRSLRHHGQLENKMEALKKGIANLQVHIENMLQFSNHVLVCLNKFADDTDEEIKIVSDLVSNYNLPFSVSTAYLEGGKGAIEVAKQIIDMCNLENDFKLLYADNLTIKEKIKTICNNIYHTNDIHYSDISLEKLNKLNSYNNLPICVAKTPYSISDNDNILGYPKNYPIHIRDIKISRGAGFIVIFMGNIMTMPGLPKRPNYEKMQLKDNIIYNLD